MPSVCVYDVYIRPLSRTPGCPPFLYAVPRDGSRARSPTSSSRDPGLSYQTRLFPPGCKIDIVEVKQNHCNSFGFLHIITKSGTMAT